jgi:hypothetical protein
MNKREWLASQGLAEIGKRGRFSREAEAAWLAYIGTEQAIEEVPAGDMLASDPEEIPESMRDGFRYAKPTPVEQPRVRDFDLAYCVDERGHIIGHDRCGECRTRIGWCKCDGGPWGLRYIQPKQKSYLVKETA